MAQRKTSEFWMRRISFAGLHRILHLVSEYSNGLRPHELDLLITRRKVYRVRRSSDPARTTLYHCRNILLHLGALQREGLGLVVNRENIHVKTLLGEPSPIGHSLSTVARDAFAALVIDNADCRQWFFDLFMPNGSTYSPEALREEGQSVTWQRVPREKGTSKVVLKNERDSRSVTLRTYSEVHAVLYGLRYWARDELELVDEFFQEARGVVIYPIFAPSDGHDLYGVVNDVLTLSSPNSEWTMLSVGDLIVQCCEIRHRAISRLFSAINWLIRTFPGYIVLIPTARSLATITARSPQREELELRAYFRDPRGRYISHIRLHQSLRRLFHDHTQRSGA
jgi:hypothetical protein